MRPGHSVVSGQPVPRKREFSSLNYHFNHTTYCHYYANYLNDSLSNRTGTTNLYLRFIKVVRTMECEPSSKNGLSGKWFLENFSKDKSNAGQARI